MPVAFTSHVMKILERLVLSYLRPVVRTHMDPLQIAYQPNIWVNDAAFVYMLQRTVVIWTPLTGQWRLCFWLLKHLQHGPAGAACWEVEDNAVGVRTDAWTLDYLTCRRHEVQLNNYISSKIPICTEAPQGTGLSPFLFTIYTSDYQSKSDTCFLHLFWWFSSSQLYQRRTWGDV